MLAFGEYRPDVSDHNASHSLTVQNVVPRADGYGPFPDFTVFTSALPAACRGYFYARNTDGSITIFAGTSTKLYKLSNTDFTWGDVSAGAGSYSALSSSDNWQFIQFGSVVIAVQANAAPQAYTLGSSSEFAALGGSPPQARYVSVVGRFVVLSGLLSEPYRIQWSGLAAITTWTSGTNQSDYQDLPDGGIVRGVAGGEYGVIFQDASIRRMTYAPGSPTIFNIDRISQDDGLFAPLSLIRAGERIFFCSAQGFKALLPGGYPIPIGREKVDRTFFADVDTANLQLMLGAADPKQNRVYWSYKSLSGQTGLFDKIICYDWILDRFTPITMTGEYLSSLSRPGITLDALDSISASIDALPFSLDDVSSAAFAQLSGVNADHNLGFFTASNLEATVDTSEQGFEGRRMFVRGFRPMTDAATVYGSVKSRESVQASSTTSTETLVNTQGFCPQRVSTRYARGVIRIPEGTSWTYATGVEPDIVQEGKR